MISLKRNVKQVHCKESKWNESVKMHRTREKICPKNKISSQLIKTYKWRNVKEYETEFECEIIWKQLKNNSKSIQNQFKMKR